MMTTRHEPGMLAPGFICREDSTTHERWIEVPFRGELLADFPMFNKGTAFTEEERDALGLRGLLPPRVVTMEDQIARVMDNYARKTTDLERYIHLISLLDRNETLFYRILLDRLDELLPIVYTPTVGQACQQFGRIYRRPRGIYITPEDISRIDEILAHWPFPDVAIIVVTDGERILGLGDLGASGMGIPIGKISLYVAGAGIHPARALPVCLDVGTDNEALLADPLYLGRRSKRLRGPEYDRVVEAFMAAVARRFPRAIVQFEDFSKKNAARLLEEWRGRARCFNDDIQGTGAVTAAGVFSALRMTKGKLEDQRVVIVGAGSAGIGIGRALAGAQLWILDSKGLLVTSRNDLSEVQKPYARNEPFAGLRDVVKRVKPTVLIGTSGVPNSFDEEIVSHVTGERPIIFPLSNPTSKSECTPDQLRTWTKGRAIIATGSPFPNTDQCNNMYVFPGMGLGVFVSGARHVSDGMFRVAAQTVARMAPADRLYPPLPQIRKVSFEIAVAVGKVAMEENLAPRVDEATLRKRITDFVWEPRYLPYRPSPRTISRETLFQGDA